MSYLRDAGDVRPGGGRPPPVLDRIAPEVFDGPVDERWVAEFMADARHHLFVPVEEGVVRDDRSGRTMAGSRCAAHVHTWATAVPPR